MSGFQNPKEPSIDPCSSIRDGVHWITNEQVLLTPVTRSSQKYRITIYLTPSPNFLLFCENENNCELMTSRQILDQQGIT